MCRFLSWTPNLFFQIDSKIKSLTKTRGKKRFEKFIIYLYFLQLLLWYNVIPSFSNSDMYVRIKRFNMYVTFVWRLKNMYARLDQTMLTFTLCLNDAYMYIMMLTCMLLLSIKRCKRVCYDQTIQICMLWSNDANIYDITKRFKHVLWSNDSNICYDQNILTCMLLSNDSNTYAMIKRL